MTADQYKECIIRMLCDLDERRLSIIYHFVLHLSG